MAVYAIGDVQGCYDQLQSLLSKIEFRPERDQLCFTGDLVNRGTQSLQVLKYVKSLPNAVTVLGNHDLHLLAVASGQAPLKSHDTISDILSAPDCNNLLRWLRECPLVYRDDTHGFTMMHAGVLPQWEITTVMELSDEAGEFIRRSDANGLFSHMYGDTPDQWRDDLQGWARLRIIINAFTRMRYCDAFGRMDLRQKGSPGKHPKHLFPWFQVPGRKTVAIKMIFGHWSTLGLWKSNNVIAIDTGCLWGERLTAVRLDTEIPEFHQVSCPQILSPTLK